MRESIITKDIVRRFLVVSRVDAAEVNRIVEGLLFDLPVTDVFDEIALAVDDVMDEADVIERLTLCAAAEDLLLAANEINGRTAPTDLARVTTAWLTTKADRWLESVGINIDRWEEARNA